MQRREAVHLFRMFEDFSKEFIDFSITSKFKLPNNFYLSQKDVYDILEENSLLIKAMYNRDEGLISKILEKELFDVDIFDRAQIADNSEDSDNLDPEINETPLPLQARYVLYAWNQLRIANLNEIDNLIDVFDKSAFSSSFYTNITQMALSVGNPRFNEIALKCYDCLTSWVDYYFYYSLLSYSYRLKKNKELRILCNTISSNYREQKSNDEKYIKIISDDLMGKV